MYVQVYSTSHCWINDSFSACDCNLIRHIFRFVIFRLSFDSISIVEGALHKPKPVKYYPRSIYRLSKFLPLVQISYILNGEHYKLTECECLLH